MLMFPYILNLLAAMLLGALIGAERQWRQRMAGLRTNALAATIIILCANILLREAAQRINQLPISAEGEKRYILKVTCNKEDESAVRQWLLNIVKEAAICLQGLGSVPAQEQGYKEIRAELVGHADYRKTRWIFPSR